MKRRGFLHALLAAPAIAVAVSSTKVEPVLPPLPLPLPEAKASDMLTLKMWNDQVSRINDLFAVQSITSVEEAEKLYGKGSWVAMACQARLLG